MNGPNITIELSRDEAIKLCSFLLALDIKEGLPPAVANFNQTLVSQLYGTEWQKSREGDSDQ